MRGKVSLWARRLTPLGLLLCASCMSISADIQSSQRKCSPYVEPFLGQTNHAPPPKNDASSEWVNFGIGEAGQVNDANSDKEKGKRTLLHCEAENERALKDAAQRAKPWYKRIF